MGCGVGVRQRRRRHQVPATVHAAPQVWASDTQGALPVRAYVSTMAVRVRLPESVVMSRSIACCRPTRKCAVATVRPYHRGVVRRRLPRVLAGVLGVGAVTAATVSASAATWPAPQTVSRPHAFVSPGGIGFTTSGAAVASWGWQDAPGNATSGGSSLTWRAPEAADFGPERALPRDVIAGPLPFGSGRVLIARLSERRSRDGQTLRQTLRTQVGDLTARFGRPEVVARRRTIGSRGFVVGAPIARVKLAVNARGDGMLGWLENRGPGHRDRLYVSVRRAGGRFGRPVRLVQEAIRSFSVAIGRAGEALAAWDAVGRIRSRYMGRLDRTFHRVDTLRSHPAFSAAIQTTISRAGRAWVAWTAQALSEGGDRGQVFVQAATRSPGAQRRFGRAHLLEHAPTTATATPVALAVDARGEATLAWALWDAGPLGQAGVTAIRAARTGVLGAPRVEDVTRFAAVESGDGPGMAGDEVGRAIVTWTQVLDPLAGTSRLSASVRTAGGSWGAPELIAEGLRQPFQAAAAFPPDGRPPIVLFATRPAAGHAGTVAQLATRDN